jgi:peroxiredoxin
MKLTLKIALAICIISAFISCSNDTSSLDQNEKNLAAGKFAPDFTLPLIDSTAEKSLSDYRGKIVLLDIWVSYCPICRMDMPNFVSIYNDFKEKGVVVIGVCLDTQSVEWARKLIDQNEVEYPVFLGNGQVVKSYNWKFGITTTFLIDKKGKIKKRIRGVRSYKKLEQELMGVL